MSVINYAVEVITEKTSFTNTSYGLVAGIFRWITGRPGYDGSTVVPKWEDATDNTYVWYEGWLLKDRMGNSSREVDLSQTGDYGTFSSFNFSIRNDYLLWQWVRDNAIYFTNRDVKLYCIVDGIFYNIWSGVVSNNPYDEIDYQFTCGDSFKKIHKPFPPLIINPDAFPGSSDNATNEPMQVVIGDCTYVKLQVITDEPVLSTVADSDFMYGSRFYAKACGASHYSVIGLDYPTLLLYNKDVTFAANELVGKYIYVTKGGGDPDTDQLILIRSNAASSGELTSVEIDAPFDFTDETLFNQKYAYDPLQGAFDGPHNCFYAAGAGGNYAIDESYGVVWAVQGTIPVWAKYDFLNLYNSGTGCNLIEVEVAFDHTSVLKIRTGSPTGPIIGEYPITATHPNYTKLQVGIEKQYGASTDLYFTFTKTGGSGVHAVFKTFTPSHNPTDQDTWWFSIVEMPSTHIISTNEIKEIVRDPITQRPYVFVYNDKTRSMDPAPYVVLDQLTSTLGTLEHPEFTMYTSVKTKDGAVRYQVPVVPESWEARIPENGYFSPVTGRTSVLAGTVKIPSQFDLCNRSQANPVQYTFPETTPANMYKMSITLQYPESAIKQEFDDIFLAVDMGINASTKVRMLADYEVLDAYGNVVEMYKKEEDDFDPEWYYPISESCESFLYSVFTLPDEYYRNGGWRQSNVPSLWPLVAENGDGEDTPMKTLLRLPDDIADALRDGTSTNMVKVNFYITSTGAGGSSANFSMTGQLYEAGFIGYKSINPEKDDFYVRIKGEILGDGTESNTVYNAFRLMLESYDGILPANIDYTNLPYIRDADWRVGRVITDQKSMFDYLKELAEDSFVAIFPSRTGKRTLRAWRDPYYKYVTDTWVDQEPTALSLPVIRDSIRSWKNTEISKLYNDFYIKFDLNPGSGKYISFIYVTKVSEAAFPSTTGQTWKTYIGGVSDGSYATAKVWWDTCSESYLRSYALQPLPKDKQERAWFTTSNIFEMATRRGTSIENMAEEIAHKGVSLEDAAYKFMDNCIRYLTRQKTEVMFSTPITSISTGVDLCRTVSFTDPVYTAGETRSGWVTKVEFDIKNNTINLGYILEPEDIVIDNLIIERGILMNLDTHTETGDQTDQVDDGQDRT